MPADQAQPATIEEMATRMVRMIRSVQPAGPYRVAGWSLGGTIAYEIATQLVGAHEQVEFIGLFDTYCPLSSAVAPSLSRVCVLFASVAATFLGVLFSVSIQATFSLESDGHKHRL